MFEGGAESRGFRGQLTLDFPTRLSAYGSKEPQKEKSIENP